MKTKEEIKRAVADDENLSPLLKNITIQEISPQKIITTKYALRNEDENSYFR